MKVAERITRIVDFFYIKPIRKIIPKQTFRYAACGGFNMLFGWILYYVLFNYVTFNWWLDLGFIVIQPHTIAYFIQIPPYFLLGFWLQRNITFRDSDLKRNTQLFRYLLQNLGAFVVNYIAFNIFAGAINLYPPVAKPVADLITVVYSYLVATFFTFRTKKK